jgi:hypothetical protein
MLLTINVYNLDFWSIVHLIDMIFTINQVILENISTQRMEILCIPIHMSSISPKPYADINNKYKLNKTIIKNLTKSHDLIGR